jgi:arsenate reductase
MGATVRQVLREIGTPYTELDLGNPKWTNEELLAFIQRHPIWLRQALRPRLKGGDFCPPGWSVTSDGGGPVTGFVSLAALQDLDHKRFFAR